MAILKLQPCWRPENVTKAISANASALLGSEHRQYFLATHAPLSRIWEDRKRRTITESEFFSQITGTHSEVMSVVHGDPGTGKSHLIHWAKLRTDDGLAS